jgi:hypothetical protein
MFYMGLAIDKTVQTNDKKNPVWQGRKVQKYLRYNY